MKRTLRLLLASSIYVFPPLAGTVTAVFVPACLKQNSGPSNVAAGKEYDSGDATYDEFFSSLFKAQLALGQAPDKQQGIVEHLGKASGAASGAAPDDVVAAVKHRAGELAKSGVTMKLALSGLDENDKPAASFSKTGAPAEGQDKDLVDAVEQAAADAATLLNDLRRSARSVDDLGADVDGLEKGVDKTFSTQKRGEVTQNLKDAERLMPLMTQRAKDVEASTLSFLQKLEKALGTVSAAPARPALDESEPPPKKPKTGKSKGDLSSKPKNDAPKTQSEAPAQEPKPAEPKPAKKPAAADDFEP
jgi:hypothetical protein